MSLTQKIAHNTIIQFSGKIIGTFIGVLTIALMARHLGQIGFGQYSTITAYLQFFAIIVDMGLSVTIIRLLADTSMSEKKVIDNVFTLRFLSALIFLGLAPLVVLFFPYDNLIKLGVAVTTLSYLFSALNLILISLFQKKLQMFGVTMAEVVGRLTLLIFVGLAIFLQQGLIAIMLAVVLGSLVNFIINYLLANKQIKINLDFDWRIWRKILLLTWPIAVSITFNLVYFKADTIILSLVRSQAEVGLYNAPYRVLEIITNFIYLFIGLIFPILATAWAEKNLAKFKDLYQKTFDALVIFSMPLIFGTMFVARDLMILIAGQDFALSGEILKIIIIATAIIIINSLFGYTIVVLDKQKQMVWGYITVAIVSLIGYGLTIPQYGYYGAAVFTIISEALIMIFNLIVIYQTTKLAPKLIIFLKTIAASLIMSISLYLLNSQNVLLRLIIAMIIYVVALYVFKGFSKEFIKEIINLKAQLVENKIDGV